MNGPKKIWAKVDPEWHSGDDGGLFTGGTFDAGKYRDGAEYTRSDLIPAMIEAAVNAERERFDRLMEYAGHRNDCSFNFYDRASACTCGFLAAAAIREATASHPAPLAGNETEGATP